MWLLSLPAGAQPLERFLESADRANFDTRASAQARAKAASDFTAAWGALLPSVKVSGGYTRNQFDAVVTIPGANSIVIVPRDQLEASVRIEVPLLAPSKWLETSAAAANEEGSQERLRAAREAAHRQVVSAFYSYLGSVAVLESATRTLQAAQAQVDFTAARTGAGVANELDLVRARAEVERNQQLVANAEALVATGARTLETLSGLAPGEVPRLPGGEPSALPPLEQVVARGVDARPAVKAAAQDTVAAQRRSTAATLALVPTVNAQFTQRFTNATGFQGQPSLYNAGVTLDWKLDVPSFSTLGTVRASEGTALVAEERARREAADQLHADWQQTRAALKKATAAQSQVTAAQRAASLAKERNAAGMATQLDVIQADRDLFAAELSQIQALAELASARALLALSSGETP